MALNSIEEFKNALSNGSVNANFDELPYIELFLAKYGSEYMKFGPIKQESGIAFVSLLSSRFLTTYRTSKGYTDNPKPTPKKFLLF